MRRVLQDLPLAALSLTPGQASKSAARAQIDIRAAVRDRITAVKWISRESEVGDYSERQPEHPGDARWLEERAEDGSAYTNRDGAADNSTCAATESEAHCCMG